MLPVFLVCAVVALAPGWPSILEPAEPGPRRYRRLATLTAAAAVFYLLVWTIVSGASDHLRLGVAGG
jgi:hypothetical protein